MAEITPQAASLTGLTPTFAAAADADQVRCNGRTLLWVKNGSGSPINVTIVTTIQYAGLAVADVVVAVPAGGEKLIGPFERSIFGGSGANRDLAEIDYSSTASVTRAALAT
jgi:hypothetical protein